MKKLLILLLVGFFSFAYAFSIASAQTTGEETKAEETELEGTADEVDKEAKEPEGEKKVVERLKTQYNVDDARIQSLRDKNFGYGEIAITFALAEQMPGGINDENIQKIVDLRREQNMGWGNVAKELGFKLGPVVSGAHKAQKPETGTTEKAETAEKPGKPEKVEKPGKPGKPENPGRPERVEKSDRRSDKARGPRF